MSKVWVLLLYVVSLSPARPEVPPSTVAPTTEGSNTPVPTLSPEQECSQLSNGTCEDCVAKVQCYYCNPTKKCTFYPYNKIFPSVDDCAMGDIRWGVCWFNFETMIICVAVVAALILISVSCCICYCCRQKRRRSQEREEHRFQQEREDRRVAAAERRTERRVRNDELRKKYGLVKDDHPYQRFDA